MKKFIMSLIKEDAYKTSAQVIGQTTNPTKAHYEISKLSAKQGAQITEKHEWEDGGIEYTGINADGTQMVSYISQEASEFKSAFADTGIFKK